MTKILKGNEVSKNITNLNMDRLQKIDIKPKVAIIRIGQDPGDISYEKSIIRYTEKLGIDVEIIVLPNNIIVEELINNIEILNSDNLVNGIMILRPLPKHINEDIIANVISKEKDIDCMNPLNLAEVFKGNMNGFLPCTSKAVVEILKYNKVGLEGANIVIINRSVVVGKPLAMMLLNENATVTICHSKTKNIKEITKNADIVITAMGKAGFLNMDYFHEKSIVIDVGMSVNNEGNLSGDVDFENVLDKVNMITPVLGGIGSITTSILINQLIMNI